MSKYAEVIVPLPLATTFTYSIPTEMENRVVPMSRVVVQFGSRRLYTAIVVSVSDSFSGTYQVKPIVSVSDSEPILRAPQLKLWNWLSDYYLCPIGDIMRAALPAGLKIESETYVARNDDFDTENFYDFTTDESDIWAAVSSDKAVALRDLARNGHKNIMETVQSLMSKGALTVSERAVERIKPKKEIFITLTIKRGDSNSLKLAFDSIKRSHRKQNILTQLLKLSDFMRHDAPLKEIPASALRSEGMFDPAALRDMASKGLLSMEKREISRFKWDGAPTKPVPDLSPAQKTALNQIHRNFIDHSVTLLHGVTSSGKTEIFIHLIDYVLNVSCRQVLYLVPEIALTTQLTSRLQAVFGERVIIYHSRFTDAERVEIWRRILKTNDPYIIIGARSSVFLPFADLGLVIVDEEHESSYKQYDPAPRYNGRDSAIVLASMHGAKTLLASATPTIETYYKARQGRYGLISLTERYSGISLPRIEIIDRSKRPGLPYTQGLFAPESIAAVNDALANNQQAIVFHNRRGYSPIARCKSCEYIPRCQDCDVSLTYHRGINRLVCHYCGREYAMPTTCPVCHEPTIEIAGYGTERIENDVETGFPSARIMRMDLDTTRNKDDYANLIDRFSQHKADILIGTQMVTKGLDFNDVSTVIVANADMLINMPEFRATERAFNMLEQVAGRAGRRANRGRVLIQTRQPDHPVLNFVLCHDYESFYNHELAQREQFGYPPFVRLIDIVLRHGEASTVKAAADTLASQLRAMLGNRIYGPREPIVSRVKSLYLQRIMVKIEPTVSIAQIKNILRSASEDVRALKPFKGIDIYFDVDPQ